jgi:hypothetical protein
VRRNMKQVILKMVINQISISIKRNKFKRVKQLLVSQARQCFTKLVKSLRTYYKPYRGDHNQPFHY